MIGTRVLCCLRAGAGWCVRQLVLTLPALWVLAVVVWETLSPLDTQLVQLLAAAPAIACAGSGRRLCVVMGGVSALFALVPIGEARPADQGEDFEARAGTCGAIVAVVGASYLTSGRRLRLVRELEQAREVAAATQDVVLRPLPTRLDGIAVAGGHLSATSGSALGGDLYEALATAHGVRVVIGDVRGHGLAALGTVAAVLGSFREAAHDEPDLTDVLRRLERAHHRHLWERACPEHPVAEATCAAWPGAPADPGRAADPRSPDATAGAGAETGAETADHPCGRDARPASCREEPASPAGEDFVTVLLLEVRPDGEVTALNCGHPWPHQLFYELTGEPRARQLDPAEAMPPLGLFPLPAELSTVHCTRLLPGDVLVLHTDGAEDARDAQGNFFPLDRSLVDVARSATAAPATVVASMQAKVVEHSGGRLADDVALLALRNDRERLPAQPAGCAGPAGSTRPW
ncbi:PP2C family protein-serine/threonine phosphatase [Streptomyces sp. SAJ15]|uniref:PP2C family protein-serine/threonine phosphatase n=1 Tax=Streptomyces sp. SAJ15 TaxID=2011095 RepID=UPI0016433704|nr:PP2C family protein-serine/threonine phosphatase [Streptomyces sp. SAJ15]